MSNVDDSGALPRGMHLLDAMAKAPDHHRVLLENEQVRVLDTAVGPGARTPLHAHQWPAALYVLSWSDFVRCNPDGNVLVDSRTMAARPEIGAALWASPIGPQDVQNVGPTELRIVAVEVKPPLGTSEQVHRGLVRGRRVRHRFGLGYVASSACALDARQAIPGLGKV